MLGCEKKDLNAIGHFSPIGFLLLKTAVAYVDCIMDHFTQTEARRKKERERESKREGAFITGRHKVFPTWMDFCC